MFLNIVTCFVYCHFGQCCYEIMDNGFQFRKEPQGFFFVQYIIEQYYVHFFVKKMLLGGVECAIIVVTL